MVPIALAVIYFHAELFLNKRGKMAANMDNAIYGESNLYEIHSKKYGFNPNGMTAISSKIEKVLLS